MQLQGGGYIRYVTRQHAGAGCEITTLLLRHSQEVLDLTGKRSFGAGNKRQNGEPDLERLRAAASCSRGSMLPLRETKFTKCGLKPDGRTMICVL